MVWVDRLPPTALLSIDASLSQNKLKVVISRSQFLQRAHGGGGDRSSAMARALAGGGDFSLWRRENLLFPPEESKEDKWPII